MKSPDRTEDERLDPEIERRLTAIDRALTGQSVDPDLAELAALAGELQAERPAPSQPWQAEMDVKAADGFGGSRLGALRRLLPDRPIGRMLAPAGALATAVVVVAVGISQSGGIEQSSDGAAPAPLTAAPQGDLGQPEALESSADSEALRSSEEAQGLGSGAGANSSEAERSLDSGVAADSVGSTSPVPPPLPGSGGTAAGKQKRQQDRNAFLALKTGTEDVRQVSDRAIQITESAGGVVLSSQLSEQETQATASLELSLPTRELDATLDQLTDLATVESLNEGSIDITKPFVSARDQLRDARAERRELLRALGNASTDAEAQALRRQLRDARIQISNAETAFNNIARRARTSAISLQITGTPDGGDNGSWDLGEAADDALSVLKTITGILLISAAILAPIGILIALTALITVRVRARRRERALDE